MNNRPEYTQKKAFVDKLLTVFGRKPVLEALQQHDLQVYKLHLAESNKPDGIIRDILTLARQRNIEIAYHDRKALSRISKNAKQDQGVALDLHLNSYQPVSQLLNAKQGQGLRLLAVDRITNPQNLGMIIRSVCASGMTGLILPRQGSARLDPLVIKASAGTLFKTPIFHCDTLESALESLQQQFDLVSLSSHAQQTLRDYTRQADSDKRNSIFILGNESDGVSQQIQSLCQSAVRIPMHNGVESLNVAVTGALIAFSMQI